MTHVDVMVLADAIGIEDTKWCHSTVDTDCILSAIVDRSFDSDPTAVRFAQVFDVLSVDRRRLSDELARIRPRGGGPDLGGHRPTGRAVSTLYRAETPNEINPPSGLAVLHSLLGEDHGPAAEALSAIGVSPSQGRQLLGLADARPRHSGPMWPPAPNPREFDWGVPESRSGWPPLDLIRPMLEPPCPAPSSHCSPTAFVWTGENQELELTAERNGPVLLTVRSNGQQATALFDAHVAEMLARHLMDFHAQLEMERWEPVFEAERTGRPKPPPPLADPDEQ